MDLLPISWRNGLSVIGKRRRELQYEF